MKRFMLLAASCCIATAVAAHEPLMPTFPDYAIARGYGNALKGSRITQALYQEYRAQYAPSTLLIILAPRDTNCRPGRR